jgi:ferredoxin
MRVWIDQDLCTGDGLCVDHCHDVFTLLEDGIAYVVEDDQVQNDPGGSGSLARRAPPRRVGHPRRRGVPGGVHLHRDRRRGRRRRRRVVDVRIAARIDIRDDIHDDEAAA